MVNKRYYSLKMNYGHIILLHRQSVNYKILMQPVLLYGSENLAVTKKKDKNKLKIFENKILRKIYGPTNNNGEWQIRYNHELL